MHDPLYLILILYVKFIICCYAKKFINLYDMEAREIQRQWLDLNVQLILLRMETESSLKKWNWEKPNICHVQMTKLIKICQQRICTADGSLKINLTNHKSDTWQPTRVYI